MKGVYKVLVDGELKTFYDYNDIPIEFDNLIKFEPEIPEGPHTHEEHEMIDGLNDVIRDLMKRERGNRRSGD